MRRRVIRLMGLLGGVGFSLVVGAQDSGIGAWQEADMNPGKMAQTIEIKMPIDVRCDSSACMLYYFTGIGFDAKNPKRKNVLYIEGGPGQVGSRSQKGQPAGSLHFLEGNDSEYNVVYFDIRGAGLSRIPSGKEFDVYLRAKYVVEDIEKLRKTVLADEKKPWDVIYAHSWGTVVAQQYAHKYGREGRASNLFLSAPVSRVQEGIRQQRENMIATNLEKIFARYKKEYCALDSNVFGAAVFAAVNFGRATLARGLGNHVEPTNDFCSLTDNRRRAIKKSFSELINKLNSESLSIVFVGSNYDDMIRVDDRFVWRYPYPREFFRALLRLQILGAPESSQVFDEWQKSEQIDAAIVAGYYLSANIDDLRKAPEPRCNKANAFIVDLAGETPIANDFTWKPLYCTRFESAKESMSKTDRRSKRAYEVFGLYDGLSLDALGIGASTYNPNGCVKGSDLDKFVMSNEERARGVRFALRRVGRVLQEPVCRWDPAKYRHHVPTVILKGAGDPLTAGGQAEYFFQNALGSDKRVFIEFPGVGHAMTLPMVKIEDRNVDGGKVLKTLLDQFLKLSAADFVKNKEVIQILSALDTKPRLPSN